MDPFEEYCLNITRRRFFARAATTLGSGLGALALGSILDPRRLFAATPALRGPHFPARAKRVIYFHMEGAPSQIDLFDYKPGLRERFNQDLPDSIRQGQRLTTMTSGQSRFPVAPSIFKFSRYANSQDGIWISELMPHLGSVAHELCFIHSMRTDAINHEPGITFFQT
ncbi:MAG: DUF1501 domain-containing protein, partial [Planctomycetes bacterium]|nr:DUF1501 domain-containing protein [Planctomycetota bacterium]